MISERVLTTAPSVINWTESEYQIDVESKPSR
jgi:hypothetical protein